VAIVFYQCRKRTVYQPKKISLHLQIGYGLLSNLQEMMENFFRIQCNYAKTLQIWFYYIAIYGKY